MNNTMQKFSGVSYETSYKHKDTSAARQARYAIDHHISDRYLNERNPFVQNDSLFNIVTLHNSSTKILMAFFCNVNIRLHLKPHAVMQKYMWLK